MGAKMTLEQVRDVLRNAGRYDLYGTDLQACDLADAIDAHLTQPAQAVDVTDEMVQTVWNVAAKSAPDDLHYRIRDKRALRRGLEAALTAALPKDSNGAEGVGHG